MSEDLLSLIELKELRDAWKNMQKRIEAEEDINDEKSQLFDLAGLIFAIGLAASAWAALVHGGGLLKFVFLLIAMVCLVSGLAIVVQVLVI